MATTILIGGKAGQGINKISEIISQILANYGYYTFNYRDYPSLIRGGHNFNILTISDEQIGSTPSKFDAIIAMDENTLKIHEQELNKNATIISSEKFKELGRNLNIAQASAFLKTLGIPKSEIEKEIKKEFNSEETLNAVSVGYDSEEIKQVLKKLKNKISLLSGSQAIAQGAVDSKLQLFIAYPMTPATGVYHELASKQSDDLMVFQGESEIACVSMALGSSFAGALSMTGTSGGGFDLMSESLSLQGITEIPLSVYLSSRPGPATGLPTDTAQGDLDVALRAGHGEFPRIVVAPADAIESIEKTNEALHLSQKFNILSIIVGDKHLAESQYAFTKKPHKTLSVKINRDVPNEKIVKASSYEVNKLGNSTESPTIAKENADARAKKYSDAKKYIEKNFEMIKIHGKKNSKNLIIGWGSTKGAILDAIEGLDAKFLQVLYIKPLSEKIKKEMQKAKNIILIENNQTGQLGRLLREKTGISIPAKNRILKYDGKPFWTDELKEEISKRLRK